MGLHLRLPTALVGGVALVMAAAGGCASRTAPPAIGGAATDYADSVPGDVYTYPHGPYAGGYAYYVRGSWYYPNADGWLRLRVEPDALRARREEWLHAAATATARPR